MSEYQTEYNDEDMPDDDVLRQIKSIVNSIDGGDSIDGDHSAMLGIQFYNTMRKISNMMANCFPMCIGFKSSKYSPDESKQIILFRVLEAVKNFGDNIDNLILELAIVGNNSKLEGLLSGLWLAGLISERNGSLFLTDEGIKQAKEIFQNSVVIHSGCTICARQPDCPMFSLLCE